MGIVQTHFQIIYYLTNEEGRTHLTFGDFYETLPEARSMAQTLLQQADISGVNIVQRIKG